MARARKASREVYTYSAYSRDPEVIERVLGKLEGELQRLREMPAKKRPPTLPAWHIAACLGCAPGTVKRWIAWHDTQRATSEISDRFCELYRLICHELAATVLAKSFAIASNVDNPRSFAAQQYLLRLMDPYTFDERKVEEAPTDQIADIPSEVLDSLNDEQRQLLSDTAKRRAADDFAVDKMLAEAAAQLAASDLDEDQ